MDECLALSTPATPTEAVLKAEMNASDGDMVEGRTVPFTEVMQEMEVALDRIEDRRRFPHANRSVMLVAVLFALGGCDKVKSYFDALADDRIKNSLERQISFEVERRLGETRSQAEGELKEIKINLAKLETDSMIAGWRISSLESAAANVRPDGSGYGVAMTKFGPFLRPVAKICP